MAPADRGTADLRSSRGSNRDDASQKHWFDLDIVIGGTMTYAGGCLCGALRYAAEGEPLFAGHCYCADCRKASGSGFVPFMGFASSAVRFSGETRQFRSKAMRGGDAVRNFCPACGGLVFGGEVGRDDSHTIYAGSLDDPSRFHPTVAIFVRDRPLWATMPAGLVAFETMPPVENADDPERSERRSV